MLAYTRKTATFLSLAVGVAVVILWMRSYRHCDSVAACRRNFCFFYVSSNHGEFQFQLGDGRLMKKDAPLQFATRPAPTETEIDRTQGFNAMGFQWRQTGPPGMPVHNWIVPHWFPVVASGVAGIAFWVKRSYQFSVRAILVAITLAALTLGAGVALSR